MYKRNTVKSLAIFIADEQEIIQRGLKDLILTFWPDADVICGRSVSSILLFSKKLPNLVITDIKLNSNAKNIVNEIKSIYSMVKVLVFSHSNEDQYAMPFFKVGIDGFLPKRAKEAEIVTAISAVLAGTKYVNSSVREKYIKSILPSSLEKPFRLLSQRELEVADLLRNGFGIVDISKRLNLKMGTVSTYKSRIFDKLGVCNLIELATKID